MKCPICGNDTFDDETNRCLECYWKIDTSKAKKSSNKYSVNDYKKIYKRLIIDQYDFTGGEYDISSEYGPLALDVADTIEEIVISSKDRIVLPTQIFTFEILTKKHRLENDEIRLLEGDIYFEVYHLLREKSRDKSTSFSMRAVPSKELQWGMPYSFDYIFKNRPVTK